VDQDGIACQVIEEAAVFRVSEEALAGDADLQSLCAAEAGTAFDLRVAPLIRARLLRQSESEHVLLITMHHSVSDGWSMPVFFRELVVLYRAYCAGAPSPLPALPIQYADYAYWQREGLVNEELD